MPESKPLTDAEIDSLEDWVNNSGEINNFRAGMIFSLCAQAREANALRPKPPRSPCDCDHNETCDICNPKEIKPLTEGWLNNLPVCKLCESPAAEAFASSPGRYWVCCGKEDGRCRLATTQFTVEDWLVLNTRAQPIPQEVKRFDVEPFSGKVELCQGGEFVLYTDYAALQSQPTQAQYAALIEVARAWQSAAYTWHRAADTRLDNQRRGLEQETPRFKDARTLAFEAEEAALSALKGLGVKL